LRIGGHRVVGERVWIGRWYRGGLVFEAHRLVYHSTLGLRVSKKKRQLGVTGWLENSYGSVPPPSSLEGYLAHKKRKKYEGSPGGWGTRMDRWRSGPCRLHLQERARERARERERERESACVCERERLCGLSFSPKSTGLYCRPTMATWGKPPEAALQGYLAHKKQRRPRTLQ